MNQKCLNFSNTTHNIHAEPNTHAHTTMSTENNDNTNTAATDRGSEPPAKKTKTEQPTQKIPQNVQDIDPVRLGVIIKHITLQQMAQDPALRSFHREADDALSQDIVVLYDHLAAIFRAPDDDA
jgi:hypothetical protein